MDADYARTSEGPKGEAFFFFFFFFFRLVWFVGKKGRKQRIRREQTERSKSQSPVLSALTVLALNLVFRYVVIEPARELEACSKHCRHQTRADF